MAQKKSFVLYTDNAEQFQILSDEQAGKLIKAIFAYSENNIVPDFADGMLTMAFSFIKGQIDRDSEKWEETRKKRAEAGRKGGRQSQANQANASFAKQIKQSQANQAVNVNVNDNVNVNVIPPISPKGDESVKKTYLNSFSESFEDFWKAYPKKVSKANALKAWNKLKPDDNIVREILSALEKQKQSSQWQKDNGQFIPYPATWLNGRRWEDEINKNTAEPQKEYNFDLEDYKALVNDFGDGENG
ncbi:MAG: DUF6291 domain-containing protein [Porcipelethomonas sp.]